MVDKKIGMEKRFASGKPRLPDISIKKSLFSQPTFNPFEERLLKITSMALRPLTTRQLSQYSGISYNAVKHNLQLLLDKKAVKRKSYKNRIYWFL